MKKYHLFPLFFLFFFVISCQKKQDSITHPSYVVYKSRADYRNNPLVGLKKDGKVGGMPDHFNSYDTVSIIKMVNGYYFDTGINFGLNTAYLSITKDEYNKIVPNSDSLQKLILDQDPYIELYRDDNHILGGAIYGTVIDTALLRQIILNNELSTKLKRLK